MLVDRGSSACGFYEPSLDLQVLRGCRNCHATHPLAMKIRPADTTRCPECGLPSQEVTESQHISASLGGFSPSIIVANLCFWAARKLAALHKWVEGN